MYMKKLSCRDKLSDQRRDSGADADQVDVVSLAQRRQVKSCKMQRPQGSRRKNGTGKKAEAMLIRNASRGCESSRVERSGADGMGEG